LKTIPLPKGALTREERRAAGKALRDKLSRTSHADWKPHANRQDPIDLLIESCRGHLQQLIPIRYGRMIQSPFVFYRGAAAIMAADLANTPTSGIRVQACGDCHLLNFGGFATPERHIVFDINDFDETLPGPWEWDIKRLAVSIVIAGRHNGFRREEVREGAVRCVQSYREHMQTYAEMGVLGMWHERIDAESLISMMQSKEWKEIVQKQIAKATSHTVLEDDFPKLASVKNGKVQIKDNPPLIFHQSSVGLAEFDKVVKEGFRRYRETLTDDLKELLDRYEIKDVAMKVVGVGSVGTRCAILLMMTADGDALFLQVKEARTSVLEPYTSKSVYQNCGQRVIAGLKLMQSASDMFLGWTEVLGRHYYIRQLRDIKIKPQVERFDAPRMVKYAEYCGWALARAHAKSGDAAMISGYLGNSSKFDEAIASFAVNYADQNERDHQALLKAVSAGKIEVYHEK
jgi:uncharacterized protein (DUF2252 family)